MGLASISNAIRTGRSSGALMPEVWRTLTGATVQFRRGQLVVVGGAPGCGKSILALRWAILSGARTIYFSADSSPATQLKRSVSVLTGRSTDEVSEAMEQKADFSKILEPINRIWWEFESSPTFDDLEDSVKAYSYLGAFPEAIIIDNLLDVDLGDLTSSEYQNVENVLLFSKELARSTGALVMVLAHLTGEYEDGVTVPPLSALRGKGGKIPEIVLNLYRDEGPMGDDLGIAIVKNREGKAKADGGMTVTLRMDLDRMLIEDHQSNYITAA